MNNRMKELDLQVLDLELNLLGAVTELKSLLWPKNYSGYASFELWAPITEKNKELLKEDRILWDSDSDTACIIEIIDSQKLEDNTLLMNIKGRTLEKILEDRIVWGTYSASNERPNDTVKNLIIQNCIEPVDKNRKIPFLEIGNCSLTNELNKKSYQKTGGNLYDAIKEKLDVYNLGFEIQLDVVNKKLFFNILESIDRTIGNEYNNDVVLFSSDLEDILQSNYYMNKTEYKNVALVSGEVLESGGTRKVIAGDTIASGFERREKWVDARDIQSTMTTDDGETIELSEEEVNERLYARGEEKLSENRKSESYSAAIRNFGTTNYIYGEDYKVGDWVTIIDERLGVTLNAQISGIEEKFENKYDLTIMFGYDTMSLSKKVAKIREN